MKANGKQSGKIFQIGTYTLQPKEILNIKRNHAFANLTTRKHHKGSHRLAIVVNGKEQSETSFMLQ
jgi:hypothetical protein